MSYALSREDDRRPTREDGFSGLKRLVPLVVGERHNIAIAFCGILVTSGSALVAPAIIAHAVDTHIVQGNYAGVLAWAGALLAIYLVGLAASYIQTRTVGGVGRRILFNLRNALFNKLQELPVEFFNQNRSGDLISRINNDTDKLNDFFSQASMQFLSNAVLATGAAIMLLSLNPKLGLAAFGPALGVMIVTRLISSWVKRRNLESLKTLGGLSGEVQENLANFNLIVAFNRLDYFRDKFAAANHANFKAALRAGFASNIFVPLYALAYSLGQLVVLAYGIWLIERGELTSGLLIGYLLYVNHFYNPLRQIAAAWPSFQLALAAFERISEVLSLESDRTTVPVEQATSDAVLRFRNVSFRYPEGKNVLHDVDFALHRHKTYALIGPTGSGKTTIASLMARLYDPTEGQVLLAGRDIRSYSTAERAQRIGFILQEPFMFAGTVRDNIVYGNPDYRDYSDEALGTVFDELGFSALLTRFDAGLDTEVGSSGDSISFGEKQLIAFMRAVLRRPDLLILDEAMANIDTVTEQLLESTLKRLPVQTTKVIIAHRLNTIDSADEILFVNDGHVIRAGSMEHAVDMLLNHKPAS